MSRLIHTGSGIYELNRIKRISPGVTYSASDTSRIKGTGLEPADSQYAWMVLALTLIIQAVSVGILVYSFAMFVVPWLETFGSSRSEVMVIIFGMQIMVGILSPVCGRLLDRYSIRLLVIAGSASLVSGLILVSMAEAVWHIAVVYSTLFPFGLVLSGTLASQTLISKWFHTNRGMAMGISSMGTSIGGFLFPVIAGELILNSGWQQASLMLALIAFCLVVPASFVILRRTPAEAARSLNADTVLTFNGSLSTAEILSGRRFWIPVVGLIPINAAFGGVQFNLGAYINDLGLNQSVAATLISITSASMICGKLFFGSLGDRTDHRKLYWVMALVLAASLLLFTNSEAVELLMLAAAFQGFATGGVMPMMGIMYSARFGTGSFGKVLGLVNMFVMMGSLGSLFSGKIFDLTGSYQTAFLVFMILLLPASIFMVWLPPGRH